MSRTYSTFNNAYQKHPRVKFGEYFKVPFEQRDPIASELPAELEVELLENSDLMKHEFRRLSRRMRKRNA